jgi:long-chain fatty acid transport protein
MRKNVLFILTIILCLTLSYQLSAQSFTLNGNGARAAGMGYAFVGVADDATAISWNAAGLSQLYTMEASAIGRLSLGGQSTDFKTLTYDIERNSSFQLNFASIVVPFSAGDYNIVGGVAYRNIYDFTQVNENNATYEDGSTDNWTNDENGGIYAITPALAVQLSDIISLGVAVNILMGDYSYDYKTSWGDMEETTVDYSGLNVDLSTLIKPTPQISIGANFSLPHTVTFDTKSKGITDGINFDTKWVTERKVPLFFSIGVAIKATDNFTIAADYRNRPWSKSEVEKYTQDGVEWENPNQYFNEYPNANSIHLGLEYLLEAGKNFVPLRVGYYTLPTTSKAFSGFDNEGDPIYDGSQILYSGVTAGLGIVMNTVIIDASYEYVFGSYVGWQETYQGSDRFVDYTYSDNRITLGLSVHIGN